VGFFRSSWIWCGGGLVSRPWILLGSFVFSRIWFGCLGRHACACRWLRVVVFVFSREQQVRVGREGLTPAQDTNFRGERGSRCRSAERQALAQDDGQRRQVSGLRPLRGRQDPLRPLQVALRPPPPRRPPSTLQVCHGSGSVGRMLLLVALVGMAVDLAREVEFGEVSSLIWMGF
jgi:hypothetical protein